MSGCRPRCARRVLGVPQPPHFAFRSPPIQAPRSAILPHAHRAGTGALFRWQSARSMFSCHAHALHLSHRDAPEARLHCYAETAADPLQGLYASSPAPSLGTPQTSTVARLLPAQRDATVPASLACLGRQGPVTTTTPVHGHGLGPGGTCDTCYHNAHLTFVVLLVEGTGTSGGFFCSCCTLGGSLPHEPPPSYPKPLVLRCPAVTTTTFPTSALLTTRSP